MFAVGKPGETPGANSASQDPMARWQISGSPRGLALLAVVLLATVPAAWAQDTTGVGGIGGTVKQADGSAVAGARVCALGSAACTTSGTDGSFRLSGLRAGSYQLEILAAEGAPFVSDPIDVRAGVEATIAVTVPEGGRLEERLTVTAPAFRVPDEVKTSGYLVEPREILKSAGALQDVSRYVQSLPGVAIGSNDFRNDLIVRGGSPLENLFVVDNVEIPNINTFANFASAGGTVSILDAALIQDVTFLSGGYPAAFVNRTSSVLQVSQREGSREQFRGWATLGFAGAGTILEGPIDEGRGSWILSARRSFLDFFSDDIGVGGVPVLYTLNGKVVYDLTDRDRVWLVNISGHDEIRLGLSEDSPLDSELYNFDIRYDGWRSATGLNWQRIFGDRGVGLFGITHSEARTRQQVKDLVRDGLPPPDVPVDDVIAGSPVVFSDDSREGETTFKYDLTLRTPMIDKFQAGGTVKIFNVRYDSAAPFGSDSPFSPVADLNAFDIRQSFTTYQTGFYVQGSQSLTRRLEVTAGARVDDYRSLSSTRVSPRAALNYQLAPGVSLRAAYGQYYQQPFLLFTSVFPENRALVPWRATHYVAGIAWEPGNGWRLTAEGYRKDYRDYPVAIPYPSVSLANVGDTFNVREILFPLTSKGTGRSQGVEIFLEKKLTARLYGQANLAFSRTQHAGLDGVLRDGSFDYPAIANVVGGYRFGDRWELSTRVSYLGGRPYTPYDEAVSSAQRRGVYDLSQVNALRAPAYFRWDVRADRTFDVRGQPVVLFAGVQNVTNRRNFANFNWNRRTNAVEFSDQQGLFPLLGFEWRF
jgi:outer membrane receptor protein involved in Fe transport